MRIAVDAMGSDNFPKPDVARAVEAARHYQDTILLVGDESVIAPTLAEHNTQGLAIEIVHTTEYILPTDPPASAARTKPNSSMHLGSQLVRDQKADAFVTAGNTGAALAICTLHTLKRIPGVKRPALSATLPVGRPRSLLIDIGANVDAKPEWLLQFAYMGNLYAEQALSISQPRVGLLSNGEEENKGNGLIQNSSRLLAESGLHFIGNVEPKEVLRGEVDVTVCDGLLGNIFMKSMEATGSAMFEALREELTANWRAKLGALLARPAFRRVYKRSDPFEVGGTLLMGVDGVVIIAHGRTNAHGMKNSIRQARQAVERGLVPAFHEHFKRRE